ncbi:MAG: DUF2793 domain-containing protein [Gammaproteobacteria bacterium]|nr:DUF2793 domain-containing protein [Gammaproteobacteria bacterium]
MTTELLNLDEILASQASKEVTHNTALRQIEGRTIRVISRTTTAQPGSPSEGDTYILPTSATGTDWATNDGKIGQFYGGAWVFYTPIEGIRIWVNDEDVRVVYDSSAWVGPRNPILSKSVAHGSPISDVTLTVAESENDILEFTGALLANINIFVPGIEKQWTVFNNTSGAFTLTVKNNSSPVDAGIAVGQGTRAIIYNDANNVVRVTSDI